MSGRMIKSMLLTALCVLLIGDLLQAQAVRRNTGRVTTRIHYYRWTVEDSTGKARFSQANIPINGLLTPGENTEIRFSFTGSTNQYDGPRSREFKLDGIGDARIQTTHMLISRRLLLSAGLNFPTGKRKLNYDIDTTIVNLLSQNYLTFPQRRFGRGWGFNGLIGVAQAIGYTRLSAGLLYEYTGDYYPYASLEKYDPGNVLSLSLSADWQRGRILLFGDVLASLFSWDTYDGADAIKQSPQLSVRVGGVRRIDNNETGVSLRVVLRGNHELVQTGYDNLETKLYGDEMHATGYFRHNFQGGLHVSPTFELRFVDGNSADSELARGESLLFGIGSGIGQRLNDRFSLTCEGCYFLGNADSDKIDLSGFQVTASLTSTF